MTGRVIGFTGIISLNYLFKKNKTWKVLSFFSPKIIVEEKKCDAKLSLGVSRGESKKVRSGTVYH